jgi:hypothetical protein
MSLVAKDDALLEDVSIGWIPKVDSGWGLMLWKPEVLIPSECGF